MTFLSFDTLGEKTINKIAEIALASQFGKADKFSVNVKTDPNLLAQGMLESLSIQGEGLVLNRYLQTTEMKIHLNRIAVSPLKALMGTIQLTKPSEGSVYFEIHQTDIERALKGIKKEIKAVRCQISEQSLEIRSQWETGISSQLSLVPRIDKTGNGLVFERTKDDLLNDELTIIVQKTLKNLFNLNNFHIEGFSINLEYLKLEREHLILRGKAGLTEFPSL